MAALAIGAGTVWALPLMPEIYTGTVYVGEVPAGAGLNVTASMTGWTSDVGAFTDESGAYMLCVLCSPSSESASGLINFYVNGVQADETHTFTEGGGSTPTTNLDLHVDYIPTPTPTPTLTSTPTPTPTATVNGTPTPTPTATPILITSNGSTIIGPSGGTANTGDGTIRITFPAGALSTPTIVLIQGGSCQHGATTGFVVGGTCFNVTPDVVLGSNASICVNLSVSDLSIALSQKSNPTLGYWFNNSWVEASNVTFNITSGILCGETNHLSHWAVLIPMVNGSPAPTPSPSASPTPTTTSSLTPTTTPQSTATPTPTPTHTPSQTDEGGTNWPLIGGIAGGVLLLAAIVIAVNRRGRGGKGEKKSRKPKQGSDKNKKDEPWDFK